MNHKLILTYLLVVCLFAFLAIAYIKYSNKTQTYEDRDIIIQTFQDELIKLQNEIDNLKQINSQQNSMIDPQLFINDNIGYIAQELENFYKKKNDKIQQEAIKAVSVDIVKAVKSGNYKTVTGKQNSNITFIQFLDYSCGFCKKMSEITKQLLQNFPDVNYIFIELPVLGSESLEISRFAIAVSLASPDKYFAFQQKVLSSYQHLDHNKLINIAEKLDINMVKLHSLLNNNMSEVESILKQNEQWAKNMNLKGTPTYIINNHMITGATDYNTLATIIKEAKN
jgi:protein-disulfide isomerase